MKLISLPTFGIAALFLATSSAHAALILQINPDTREMALVGLSSGLPFDNGTDFNPVTFRFADALFGEFDFGSYSVSASDDFYTIDRPDANLSFRISSDPGSVSIALLFESPEEVTITGTGVFLNYGTVLAGFDSEAEFSPAERFDQLEDGTVLSIIEGSGFNGGITVQIIPEPGAVILGFLGMIPLLRRRRG